MAENNIIALRTSEECTQFHDRVTKQAMPHRTIGITEEYLHGFLEENTVDYQENLTIVLIWQELFRAFSKIINFWIECPISTLRRQKISNRQNKHRLPA